MTPFADTISDLVVGFARGIVRPLGFIFSPTYRHRVRGQWARDPLRGVFQFTWGAFLFLILLGLISFIAYALISGAIERHNRRKHPMRDLRQRIEKKIQEHRDKYTDASKP